VKKLGRIRDLIKALSTNSDVIEEENDKNIQKDLKKLLEESESTQNRITTLEHSLEISSYKERLKEELKTTSTKKATVTKRKNKSENIEKQETIEER